MFVVVYIGGDAVELYREVNCRGEDLCDDPSKSDSSWKFKLTDKSSIARTEIN